MKRIGNCKKCGEEFFWDDDEKRIDNPATMLPDCCVHETAILEGGMKKRGRGRPRSKHPKKQFATRLAHDVMVFLDERKRDGFKKAITIENALKYYQAFLTKELRK